MKQILFCLLILAGISTLFLQELNAGSAIDRAAALKTWRAQCSEPDPDLQLGYIEEAIALKDESILRICLRQALISDNADTRNLALRTAITARERIIFETTMPPELKKDYKDAGKDKKKLAKVDAYYISIFYDYIVNGLTFEIRDAELGSNHSLWFSIAKNSEAHGSRYGGRADVIGSRITWTGQIYGSSADSCDLNVQLDHSGQLKGTLKCGRMWSIPISAPML